MIMFSEKYMNKVIELENDVEDYHQLVLDLFWDEWYPEKEKCWSYSGMLKNVTPKYGDFEEYLVMMGKFNQQVCQNGLDTYWSHWGTDGMIHYRLQELNKYYGKYFNSKVYEDVDYVLNNIKIDNLQYYEEETYDEEDDSYYMGEYENENYGCVLDKDELNHMYFRVSKEWMNDIESYCKNVATKKYNEYLKSN